MCPPSPGFGERIKSVGGIHKPKLVECYDSAGREHKQLVKAGGDDLRQDAVMQQFFGLMNNFLQASGATRKRQLRIVTYKVCLACLPQPYCNSKGQHAIWRL